jgi:hypothetical protein
MPDFKQQLARLPLPVWMLITVLAIAIVTALGPREKVLGANARIVYLHGVWVWASLAGFILAGLSGLLGLLKKDAAWQRWSRALGRAGLFFWITYLPISMWAMQTSWNGLYLAEPRFRLAVIFSVTGLLLQIGVTFLEKPAWAAAGNLGYVVTLFVFLAQTQNVMHPPSPILNSNAPVIQTFFAALLVLTLLLLAQVSLWWRRLERQSA